MRAHPTVAGFEDGRGHEPRDTGSLGKPGRTRKWILAPEPPEKNTFILDR